MVKNFGLPGYLFDVLDKDFLPLSDRIVVFCVYLDRSFNDVEESIFGLLDIIDHLSGAEELLLHEECEFSQKILAEILGQDRDRLKYFAEKILVNL